MGLLQNIEHWALLQPDRPAHISPNSILTYAQLWRRARYLAATLVERIPANAMPIAVLGHKEPEMLIAFLASIQAGHPYIPLDTSLPAHRVEYILKESAAALLLTPEEILRLEKEAPPHSLENFQPALPQPQTPWYIIYTSGSTGNPKGVVISTEALESFVKWTTEEQSIAPGKEVFLNQAPFSFDLSVMDLYSSLANGGTLFSLTREQATNPRLLYETLQASKLTFWVSTPSFAQLCLTEPSFSAKMLPEIRTFWFCGETLSPEVASSLLKRFPNAKVWNTYGPTEATVATTSVEIDEEILAKYSPLPVGYPKPGSEIHLWDSDAQSFTPEKGEIVILGENVSNGYLNQTELTARSFGMIQGRRAYYTGDTGHWQDGMLFFNGRIDFQIKLHGYRIEIGDIEANLQRLSIVQDAVVLPKMSPSGAEYLAAFVTLTDGVPENFATIRNIKESLALHLPEYMVPRKIIFLNQFPLTANGKADRRSLAEHLK